MWRVCLRVCVCARVCVYVRVCVCVESKHFRQLVETSRFGAREHVWRGRQHEQNLATGPHGHNSAEQRSSESVNLKTSLRRLFPHVWVWRVPSSVGVQVEGESWAQT